MLHSHEECNGQDGSHVPRYERADHQPPRDRFNSGSATPPNMTSLSNGSPLVKSVDWD